VLSDGSIQFSAPTKGASSKSTHRTRCEWTETQDWTLASAQDHWNRQTMTLTKVNAAQKVVIAQMHVRGDDGPPVKVFWNKGNITLGFRRTFNQTDPVNSTVLKGVPLGATFHISIHTTSEGVVTVTAECNGYPPRRAICSSTVPGLRTCSSSTAGSTTRSTTPTQPRRGRLDLHHQRTLAHPSLNV
jgi:hypothetical protein